MNRFLYTGVYCKKVWKVAPPVISIAGYNKVQILLSQSCVFISLKSQLN